MALTSTSLNLLFQGITIAISIGQPIVPNSACFPASLASPLAPAPVFQETVLFQHVSCLWYGQQPNLTGTGVGGTTVITSPQPTSTTKAATECKSDNCLRALAKRPEATTFCATYTAGGTQALLAYAANG
ncbi:hypothetical protein BGZ57DRAFT_890763 [Hyaloscypha finlandica]|nr:hypothetical protein BGZ57DRAFT_890763 [Hyaloscypha finlandica]